MRIRLGRRQQMLHKPSAFGKGKWENLMSYIRYKLARRKAGRVAGASRRANR